MTITVPSHREPTPLECAVVGRQIKDIFLTRGCLMIRFTDGGDELFASDARVRDFEPEEAGECIASTVATVASGSAR